LIANDLVNSSSHVIHQILNGIKMIKIGNLENKELKDFSKLHKQYDTHEIIVGKLRAFSGVIQEVFFILLLFSSVFLVRYVYPSDGLVEVGSDILAYLFMLLRFVPSARGVISSRGTIIGAYGPLSRIVAILKRENGGDWLQNQETDKLKTEINTLRLNKVSFNYSDDEDMSSLNGVTYEFKQGKRYAIVGPSGSGKSTLLDLCAGIIQPKDGQIFINQDKIDNTRKLRDPQVVSYVNQEPVIFHTNMRDNISFYNRDASESEIEEAVSYAQLENLISANKDGLDMLVGERGQALSGGEKQRIGLARSFLQKSFVMLIDEGTNALDYITEKNVYDSIQKVGSDKIVIVVAHRITAIKDFDEILVLKNGCIVESGTHHQLMSLEGEYVKLIHSHNDVT
jgi:ABC-type multidrug transport system fused ATPase/permease subunit